MSRRRDLSEEEAALWHGFARSITPLRPGQAGAKSARPRHGAAVAAAKPPPTAASRPSSPPAKPLTPLDRRLKQRLGRGRHAIDVRLDLHGMTQREAHGALIGFLRQAQADGARVALIVTGKGGGQEPRHDLGERGVLRRQVPMWLALPEFRRYVVGFDTAHFGHGGEGALYVRLRRPR